MPPESSPTDAEGNFNAAKLAIWKQHLYDQCRQTSNDDRLFSQADLLDLDVIPGRNAHLLVQVVQLLCNDRLLVGVQSRDGVAWKWRDRDEAEKYKLCTTDEQAMVYSIIDDAGGDGIWTQTIQKRLHINDSLFKAAIKHLVAKQLIAPFKNVEHPNKKVYIKASIQPSDRATGGPWYTDQNLDMAFIKELHYVIFNFIKRQSSYRSTRSAGRAPSARQGILKNASNMHTDDATDEKIDSVPSPGHEPKRDALLPLPAGYKAYPTVREIARLISTTGITNNTILTEVDVQKLVDVLVYDDLIEPIRIAGRLGYRVTRVCRQKVEGWSGRPGDEASDEDPLQGTPLPYTTSFAEAPCGRCPVFDLCEEGGPVGPSNCVYFQTWLENDF